MADAMENLLGVLIEFVPRLMGAVVVLLVALVVAYLLQRLVSRFLQEIGLDDLFESTGAANPLSQLGYEGGASRLLGIVLFWGLMLTGLAGSLSVLGLSSLENTMNQIVTLSGRALVALVILIAGAMSAGWLAERVGREAESAGLPEDVATACDRRAHIAIVSESLNAAMAATVALYEAARS